MAGSACPALKQVAAVNRQQDFFRTQLLYWHCQVNERQLPWKQEKDAYRIWLSEIILQQTRAAQGLPYYLRFTEQYPTIKDLAAAADEAVFRLWQGLGYYNRCKNMLATARLVCDRHNGVFPSTYEEIRALKGIGPYTAAAIASFAFGLPHAVVDGNVYRVLSRYFGIDTAMDSTEGKRQFAELADVLLDPADSAAYNQAIMDFGATVCTPRQPACPDCPFRPHCAAYRQGRVAVLPVKEKKTQVRNRYFHYFLFRVKDQVWIRKRSGRDIWENLHEPFLVETEQALDWPDLCRLPALQQLLPAGTEAVAVGRRKQRLTHQLIDSRLYEVALDRKTDVLPADGFWVSRSEMARYAFPKTLTSFLDHV